MQGQLRRGLWFLNMIGPSFMGSGDVDCVDKAVRKKT